MSSFMGGAKAQMMQDRAKGCSPLAGVGAASWSGWRTKGWGSTTRSGWNVPGWRWPGIANRTAPRSLLASSNGPIPYGRLNRLLLPNPWGGRWTPQNITRLDGIADYGVTLPEWYF